jgi:hypothetical protein
MRDCEVVKSDRHTVETDYQLKRIEAPAHAAPAHFARAQSDGLEVARAALNDEVAF